MAMIVKTHRWTAADVEAELLRVAAFAGVEMTPRQAVLFRREIVPMLLGFGHGLKASQLPEVAVAQIEKVFIP